jgi:hypothetical protein
MKRFLAAYRSDSQEQILMFTIMVHDLGVCREMVVFVSQAYPGLRWTERASLLSPKQIAPRKPFDFLKSAL